MFLFLFILLTATPFTSSAKDLSPTEYERVCKGAISAVFFPPIDSIRVVKEVGPVVFVSDIRKSDGSQWNTRCRIDGSSIIWATADGRWRTHPKDEKISFRVDRASGTFTIRQAFEDGSSDEKTFPLDDKSG